MGGVSMEFACMHGKGITLIRRLIPGYFFPLFIVYVIVLLSRSGRDDDMDQDRGKVVYNIPRLVQGQLEIREAKNR